MNFKEEEIIGIGIKVLEDIGFMGDDVELPSAKYFHETDTRAVPDKSWLVTFPYGAEDYGTDSTGKSFASMIITIFDDDGIATSVLLRNGYVKLGFNTEEEKYFVETQRP